MLVCGESGVGKEVVARLLHEHDRRSGDWVPVNCAAIPEPLIEAELFGYVRGAFTGAARAQKGFVEQANGAARCSSMRSATCRWRCRRGCCALQERRIKRIGSETATSVDFRLVCAMHRDLPAMVRAGDFRENLYYRINVITVQIPPLRERREDILWLADRMLAELPRASRGRARRLSLPAQQALFASAWQGNVRELNHVLRRAVALGAGPMLDVADLFATTEQAPPRRP